MYTKKRSIFCLFICFIMLFMLPAGCAPKAPAVNTKTEPVTLVWSYWGDPWEIEINEEIAAKYEETHENIKIEHQYAPWSSYFEKLETQWAGGTSPDVMFLTNVPSYAAKGVLADMGALAKENNYNMDDYYPEALKLFQYEGKLYGVPRDNDTKVLFYNKKLFDEAQLPYPDKSLTWDGLISTASKLTKRDASGRASQYGIAFDPNNWFLYIWMNGAQFLDDYDKPTKVLFEDPKVIEALQNMGDLINKHKCAPSYELIKDSSQIAQMFMANQIAMVVGNHALIPSFLQAKDLSWDVAYLPAMNGNPKKNVMGGAGYVMSSMSKHPKEAYDFWAYVTGPEAQKMFVESKLIVPANKTVLTSDEFLKQSYNAQVFVDETAVGQSFPTTSKFSQLWMTANQYFEGIWTGEKSADAVVKEAIPELAKIIAE